MGQRPKKEIESPIVFCHGLLGWGQDELCGYPYFVAAAKLKEEKSDNYPPFLFPSTGPVSSLHDQACELFFQLKGGLTDYGESHSNASGHRRYTRFYGDAEDPLPKESTGYGGVSLYPQWDSEHPLDFVAHSMGVPVVRMMQYMLAEDFFYNECGFPIHTDASWIRSLSSVAGVHNGSQLTWILGADEDTGLLEDSAYAVDFLCKILKAIGRSQNKRSDGDYFFDLHLDQWNLLSMPNNKRSLPTTSESSFYSGKDWAMYDLTPNAMEKHNSALIEYPNTLYFSYAVRATFSLFGLIELPIPFVPHWVLVLGTFLIGNFRTKNIKWKTLISKWRQNDGMCPSDGQKYPYLGRTSEKFYKVCGKNDSYKKGVWNVFSSCPFMDHAEPAMMPHLCRLKAEIRFYESILNRIIDARTLQ